ncbi:MAG TPA: DUF1877 family protein, partial [Polyangiaceae bacterium]
MSGEPPISSPFNSAAAAGEDFRGDSGAFRRRWHVSQTFDITFVEDAVLETLEEGDDARIASIMFSEDRPTLTLGKAWHVLHMLLTGSTQAAKGPRAFIMGSGRFLGNDANGGWVSAFDSKQVIGIYTRLPTPETL